MLQLKYKQKENFLLASSLFHCSSSHALVDLNFSTNTILTPDGGQGYNFNANGVNFEVISGYIVGQTAGVSFDNVGNRSLSSVPDKTVSYLIYIDGNSLK